MPLSRARMRERKRQDRASVKPVSNLNSQKDVKPDKPILDNLRKMIRDIEQGNRVRRDDP